MRYITPLRYPGGKAGLTSWVSGVFDANELDDVDYVEPYAGGAGLAFGLFDRGYIRTIHINDIDPGVAAFWTSVITDPDSLCRKIRQSRVSVCTWRAQLEILKNPASAEPAELGFAFFFANRVSRSGIVGGGVIGGQQQAGGYAIDARFNKRALIERILAIAFWGNRIKVTRMDGRQLVASTSRTASKQFLFIDPPYYFANSRRLYTNALSERDHEELAIDVQKLRVDWVLSYDDHPKVRQLYSRFNSLSTRPLYCANGSRRGRERLFASNGLNLPGRGRTGRDLVENW